jgi:asparagine synthase (glutamine-hydrolysing)
MCGFLGFVNQKSNGVEQGGGEAAAHLEFPQNPNPQSQNKKTNTEIGYEMLEQIKHRGPDAQKVWSDDDITLGFARLSFQDIEHGHQPMFLNDKSKCILFNGEIYNFQDIKIEIENEIKEKNLNLKFQTTGDTEVILIGYELWGEQILQKLRGMFAFAIYDFKKKEFFFARDNFGIKPFYYYKSEKSFVFASEIKVFLKHPNFKKEFNEKLLPSYLTFSCVPSTTNETFFKNVFRLPPAHFAKYSLETGKIEIQKYWQASFSNLEIRNKNHLFQKSSVFHLADGQTFSKDNFCFEQYVEEIEKTFSESVAKHMIADKSVEVGAFLSGGVDSAYTVAEASKHIKPQTFTIGFTEEKFSEASEARHTANLLNVKNTEVKVSAESYLENVKNVQWHMDEPLANPSANLLFELAKETGKHVKAVLSGEGADEMFGGYNVYKEPLALANYQKLPIFFRKNIEKIFNKFNLPGKNFISRGAKSIEERYVGNSNVFSLRDQKKVLNEKYFDENWNPLNETKKVWHILENKNLDDISKMQFLDIHMWMVQEILLKADKMSMAHSLELRVPFLDKEIWNIGRKIPLKYKVNLQNTKLALRAAAFKVLDKVSSERKKKAFPSPLPEWLKREDFYNKIKTEFESEIAEKYFDKKYLIEILDEHKNNRKNNVRKIWTVYTFLVWYREFFINR